MEIPRDQAGVDALMGEFNSIMADIRSARERAVLVNATVRKLDDNIAVSVNAEGVVVDTVIDEDALSRFPASRIAAAITEAAQEGAREVSEKRRAIWDPVNERSAQLPRASDIDPTIPDFAAIINEGRPEVPLNRPVESMVNDPDETYEYVEEQQRGLSIRDDRDW